MESPECAPCIRAGECCPNARLRPAFHSNRAVCLNSTHRVFHAHPASKVLSTKQPPPRGTVKALQLLAVDGTVSKLVERLSTLIALRVDCEVDISRSHPPHILGIGAQHGAR